MTGHSDWTVGVKPATFNEAEWSINSVVRRLERELNLRNLEDAAMENNGELHVELKQ